ncbi:MAG: hypothetical protein GY858_05220 [Candidatus Omnitrophica bacterium]|nr:hypothetical protein [Candidatus Omnitrophota bacterium]
MKKVVLVVISAVFLLNGCSRGQKVQSKIKPPVEDEEVARIEEEMNRAAKEIDLIEKEGQNVVDEMEAESALMEKTQEVDGEDIIGADDHQQEQ